MKITVSKDEYGRETLSHCLKIETKFKNYEKSGLTYITKFELVPYQVGWDFLKEKRKKVGYINYIDKQEQVKIFLRDNFLKAPEGFWEIVNQLPKTTGDDWNTYIW